MAGRRVGTMYTAGRRLYLDDEGRVCEASSPRRLKLLVPAGGKIPMELAERLGLVTPEEQAPGLRREDFVSVDHPLYKFMVDAEPDALPAGDCEGEHDTALDAHDTAPDAPEAGPATSSIGGDEISVD